MSDKTLADCTFKELLCLQVQLLMDIRDALVADAAEEGNACVHPEETRVSLSTPDDPNHWVCAACKFDNKELVMQ